MRIQIGLGVDQGRAKGLDGIPGCPPGELPGQELALVGGVLRRGLHSVRRFDGGCIMGRLQYKGSSARCYRLGSVTELVWLSGIRLG